MIFADFPGHLCPHRSRRRQIRRQETPAIMETGYGRTCRGGYLRLSQMQQMLYHQGYHSHDKPAAKPQGNGTHAILHQTFQIGV